jgi:ring-1,2-phenylacetyl-CoA epoxidase subunit PaaD
VVRAVAPTDEAVWELLSAVTDPEIPVLTIEDIGILRDVTVAPDGTVDVVITPTYSGCPAMGVIREDIESALESAGYSATVSTRLMPAWTTDWMTGEGKEKLRAYGVAPPGATVSVVEEVLCPMCDDSNTRVVSEFGSTACKRLMVCTACGEPFDQFKAI